jgi:hypothetical protein
VFAHDHCMDDDANDVLDRVAREIGGMDAVERLAALSGSDFASVMLEVVRRRAARETPASVLRRYRNDRFVRPGGTSWWSGRRAEDALLGCLPADVEMVTLAPLVPLGAHSALGTVSQHKVVTAIRACEVAADPTNALALEAAVRRADPARGTVRGAAGGTVRLAAIQQVVRAQRFPAGWSAHFKLLAVVAAGRDAGSCRFERDVLGEQLRFAVAGLRAAGVLRVQVALTPLSEAGERIVAATAAELAATSAEIVTDRDRVAGRGYYRDVCFKVNALGDGVSTEIGDGGFTDWTARLLANRKERLLISGYGLDRLGPLTD